MTLDLAKQCFLVYDTKSNNKNSIQIELHENFLNFVYHMIPRVKRQPTEWEKTLANHIPDKRLMSKIHRTKKNPIQKWTRYSNTFHQKRYMNKHIKRCTSLIITKMQTKTTRRYNLTPRRMVKYFKKENYCWSGCKDNGTLVHC